MDGQECPSPHTHLHTSRRGQPRTAVPTWFVQGEIMLVVMQAQATEEQVRAVCQKIEKLGYRAHSMPGAQRTAIGITGNTGEVEQGTLEEMPGVQEVIKVSKPYKLVSRDIKQENTVIRFPGTAATIGGPGLAIVAGPCAIENREQAFAVAERVARAGAQFFRGGAYKPRTSPYSFQGLAEEGLRIMAEILFAEACWTRPQARSAQARHVGHTGRIPDGGRIHPKRGQLQRSAVRTRRADLRRPHA